MPNTPCYGLVGTWPSGTHCVVTEVLSGLSKLTRLQATVLLPEVYVVEATMGWVLLSASLSVVADCTEAILKTGLTLFSAASGVSVSSLRSGPVELSTADPCSSSHTKEQPFSTDWLQSTAWISVEAECWPTILWIKV